MRERRPLRATYLRELRFVTHALDLTEARLARLDANMVTCFRILAEALPTGAVVERPGLVLVATGADAASFNVGFVTGRLAEPRAAIAEAVDWYEERSLPFCIRVRSELDPGAGRACRAASMTRVDTMPAMLLPDISAHGLFVEGLDILEAREPLAAADHAAVVAAAFDVPHDLATLLVSDSLLGRDDFEIYVGYHAGYPVAASSLVVTGDVAGVYNVATTPRFRNRGYGEAMTWHAIRRAAQLGCEVATLQSTRQGFHIYERMGFRTVGTYITYQRTAR